MDVRSFYGTWMNGMLDALAPRLDAATRARLRGLGIDPDARHEVYPAAEVYRAVPVMAAAIAPGLPPEEAEFRLGTAVVEGYLAWDVGRTMVGYFMDLGTRDTLLDAGAFFQSGQNFMRFRGELRGERAVRLRISGTGGHAHLFRGIIVTAHCIAGEPSVEATVVEEGEDDAVLDFTW